MVRSEGHCYFLRLSVCSPSFRRFSVTKKYSSPLEIRQRHVQRQILSSIMVIVTHMMCAYVPEWDMLFIESMTKSLIQLSFLVRRPTLWPQIKQIFYENDDYSVIQTGRWGGCFALWTEHNKTWSAWWYCFNHSGALVPIHIKLLSRLVCKKKSLINHDSLKCSLDRCLRVVIAHKQNGKFSVMCTVIGEMSRIYFKKWIENMKYNNLFIVETIIIWWVYATEMQPVIE